MEFQIVKLCMTLIETAWQFRPVDPQNNKECPSLKDQYGGIAGQQPLFPSDINEYRRMTWRMKLTVTWHILNAFKAHY